MEKRKRGKSWGKKKNINKPIKKDEQRKKVKRHTPAPKQKKIWAENKLNILVADLLLVFFGFFYCHFFHALSVSRVSEHFVCFSFFLALYYFEAFIFIELSVAIQRGKKQLTRFAYRTFLTHYACCSIHRAHTIWNAEHTNWR